MVPWFACYGRAWRSAWPSGLLGLSRASQPSAPRSQSRRFSTKGSEIPGNGMADLDEEDGEKLAHPGTLVISEGKVADKSPADEPRGEWTYKLDPARKPKAIDLII